MSENGEKHWSVFPKDEEDFLKCFHLSTVQTYSGWGQMRLLKNYKQNNWLLK